MHSALEKKDVKQLNSFLRGEISAIQTYDQALQKVDEPAAAAILQECRSSHARRVALLQGEVRSLGGDPADGSGAWGAFAKAVEGGAKVFGESAAVAALEEGEDHGLADYRGDLDELSPAGRTLVLTKLLPEQQKTHSSLSRLKSLMS